MKFERAIELAVKVPSSGFALSELREQRIIAAAQVEAMQVHLKNLDRIIADLVKEGEE